ncbi:putative Glycosyltransferase 36 [uncultured Desulfobacterium sp.]|uniref:Putative Glycosyltransferase 36 n=1 Tax=uncultured Desulfobacterium sp. TaxID=201089 RepID=A0A445N2T5_9BACT|nr:putative Glycosyltransferase 36 [uncultured Desulfobacterium sp.]
MSNPKRTITGCNLLVYAITYAGGIISAAGVCLVICQGRSSSVFAGFLGLVAGILLKYHFTRKFLSITEAIQDSLIPAIFAASFCAETHLWQVPSSWGQILTLTDLGSALFCLFYFTALIYCLAVTGRHLGSTAGVVILLIPYLFNGLLILGATGLMEKLGNTLASGLATAPWAVRIIGRTAVIAIFNEIVLSCISLLLTKRWIKDIRIHVLLVLSAGGASLTPEVADFGSGDFLATLPMSLALPITLIAVMISQAGLWSQTFLITGVFIDAIHGKKPSWYWDSWHYRMGFLKGAVYGLVFMCMIYTASLVIGEKAFLFLTIAHPYLSCSIAGALLFPLFKTIIETFDGSARFLKRAALSFLDDLNYIRGTVIGVFVGYCISTGFLSASGTDRFLFGLCAGASAYAGVNILTDAFNIMLGNRKKLQSWRIYCLEACLGGAVGGGLAWYLDGQQIQTVVHKVIKYASYNFYASGIVVESYVIYPLCSKWGAMDLGQATGGVRLLYNEALSGVINWSLAAPLFGINLIVLTAFFKRTIGPIKELFTEKGLVTLVEQTVRVLRWGLWMAPVIYSLLRMSQDPTWYNQDGAIRTIVTTIKSWTLEPSDFRSWSLSVFLGILVHDWLRVLIFIDHMGLRVATMVNLSFVGADLLDEKAARAIGHSARARCIPEGLRHFFTWAPLLIPFYLPRGADWDYVWTRSAILYRELSADGHWPAVDYLAGFFLLITLGIGTVFGIRRLEAAIRTKDIAGMQTGFGVSRSKVRAHILTNGVYTVEVMDNGAGYSRVYSAYRKGFELDITRRPDDPLHMQGKFFYLVDREKQVGNPERFWSIGSCPVWREGAQYSVIQPNPLSLILTCSYAGIKSEAHLRLNTDETVELWRVRLFNMENFARRIELISYQEFGMNQTDAYRRHPFFNHLHAGTRFVRPMAMLLAGNRLLKDSNTDPTKRRMTKETAFHALKPAAGVRLLGYEDSRSGFIGNDTLKNPAAIEGGMRNPEDEGLLYTFDPIASLRIQLDLAPLGSAEVDFLDGYAPNEQEAISLLARHTGIRPDPYCKTWKAFSTPRGVNETTAQANGKNKFQGYSVPYSFSENGEEIRVGWNTPQPWAHVMANPLGYGALVTNHGSMYSFMGNSQQNGITPFDFDAVSSQSPGQVLYIMDLDTGETDSPTYIPFRKKQAISDVTLGRGYAVFRKLSNIAEMELTQFILAHEPAEVRILKIKNRGSKDLHLRVAIFAQIILGEMPIDTRGKIQTDKGPDQNVLFFSNPENDFFKGWAFVATNISLDSVETIRSRFIGGPDRDLTNPYMLENGASDESQPDDGFRIAGLVGGLNVPAMAEESVIVIVGQTKEKEQAAVIIRNYLDLNMADEAFSTTKNFWKNHIPLLQVKSNDADIDMMVNTWLPYQVLVSRLWGKLGPNQRSGAYGFRDQLQDVLPFIYFSPDLARRQVLLHSAQQFLEGDVLQWWHQSWEGKTGVGFRGRSSDPHLWLPYLVSHYVKATGDTAILNEETPFLEGNIVSKRSEGILLAPRQSRESASLYIHCLKAIDLTLNRMGTHGLPLLGTGDWNDGMDIAGFRGKAESVWLGFFLYDVLRRFSDIVGMKEGGCRKVHYEQKAFALRSSLDSMWRKDRYVRAITDKGEEILRADALMASWPIISGIADFDRGCIVMETALNELERHNLVLLFSPPYTEDDKIYPGRLSDYPPGVRENAGQYSHGATWLVDALLLLSDMAREKGMTEKADLFRLQAVQLWIKISPLSHMPDNDMAVYGLPPHQQAADISYGPGYEGRGGWSWYTGAAGRMLYTAYELFGLRLDSNHRLRVSRSFGDSP